MPTPPLDPELAREAYEAWRQYGTKAEAARSLGINRSTLSSRIDRHQIDPAIQTGMDAIGTGMVPAAMWIKTPKTKDGVSHSVYLRPDQSADDLSRIREMFEGVPSAPEIPKPEYSNADLLTLIPIADVHMGMVAWGREVGEAYDTKIACDRVTEWVGRCVASSPASDLAVIVDVGDYTHADDQTNQTPRSKHVLDVDTRHFRTLEVAIQAMIIAVELALAKHARVVVRILPGNHNPHSYLAVMFALGERYRENPRVEVQKDPSEFWVYEFGSVMLAAHHGDKAKAQRIVNFMAAEYAEIWGRTRSRFLFTGHLHHHKSEDIGGVTWEQLRAVTSRDAYAFSHAYCATAQLQAITYHRERGEIQRVKVGL